jgi:transcriptional regulator with XRE-family HTH domain
MCVAGDFSCAHIGGMDSQDKNGGPNFLREWRAFRGLTQQQLAEAVGTNSNMIQYLETGGRGLSAKWLRRLAPALDTTPGMILDHDPHELDSDILEIWATASNREKRQIKDVAKALVRDGTKG